MRRKLSLATYMRTDPRLVAMASRLDWLSKTNAAGYSGKSRSTACNKQKKTYFRHKYKYCTAIHFYS